MICTTLNYIEYFLTLVFAVTGSISISTFASLVVIPTGIMNSTIGLNICTITARIKKYNLIGKKKKKNHDEIIFLAKTKYYKKLSIIKSVICRTLIINCMLHKFIKTSNILINNVILLFEVQKEKRK